MKAVLAIDQGTTSTRSLLIDETAKVRCAAQIELQQYYPADGWVEHDPEAIWRDVVATAREVLEQGQAMGLDIAAIGIANQRETCVLWDRESGKPIHPAIVWQDRRGADLCRRFIDAGLEPEVTERTGLLLDQCQIMQRIEHEFGLAVAPPMPRDLGRAGEDHDLLDEALHDHLAEAVLGRHRVVVAAIAHQGRR